MTVSWRDRIRNGWPVGVIAGVYVVMALILNPAYDWPVIDAWAFGWTVDHLLETGTFYFVNWGAMSQVIHVWWGALFSLPAGFSFGAVNLSSYVLSFVTVLASYLTLRELPLGRWFSLVGALLIVVNPAFILLSYSYMTDVPFLAWFTLGMWAYVRGLRREDWRWLVLGSVFATLAVLIRQNGLMLPAALGAYLGWHWLRRQRGVPWREGLAAALLPVLAMVVLTILSRVGIMPDKANALGWLDSGLTHLAPVAEVFRILLYLGLFALPLTVPAALGRLWQGGRFQVKEIITPGILFLLTGAGAIVQFLHPFKLPYVGTWRMMPYYPAVWSVYGSGSQGEWQAGAREMVFSYRFWIVITALSCVGAALLLWPAARRLWRMLRNTRDEPGESGWPLGFLWLAIATYLAPLLIYSGVIYERYLLGALLPVAALVLRSVQRQRIRLGAPAFGVVAAIFLAFSLALTGELIAWNGAAWQAAGDLAAQGVPVDRIDGGFSFNGWNFAEVAGWSDKAPEDGSPAYMEVTPQITRDYVVSFSPIEGYEIVDRRPYWSPLSWAEKDMVVLRREGIE